LRTHRLPIISLSLIFRLFRCVKFSRDEFKPKITWRIYFSPMRSQIIHGSTEVLYTFCWRKSGEYLYFSQYSFDPNAA
jgi:hypothetical protein